MSEDKAPKPEHKKKQHYVPQFYLKAFADKFNRLFVFNKGAQKTRPAHVKEIAHENYFYKLPDELGKDIRLISVDGEEVEFDESILQDLGIELNIDPEALKAAGPQIIEDTLDKMESGFAHVFRDVLSAIERTGGIESYHKELLAPFLVIQFLRTADYRRDFLERNTKLLARMAGISRYFSHGIYENNLQVEFNKENIPLHHARIMFNQTIQNELINALCQHIWIVGINDTPQPFYTSDTPIVKRSHFNEPGKSHTGLGSPGIEINFPLSPKYALKLLSAFGAYGLQA
jgi:hypothetical protein